MLRAGRHWHRFPREVVDANIPGNIQGQVGRGSDPGEDVPAHCRQLDWMALKGPFRPQLYSIL